jgi:Smg protein
MFEVLVYVYENYWQGDACPELPQLGRKLTAVGFEADDIQAALIWLDGLNTAAQSTQIYLPKTDPTENMQAQSPGSMRAYNVAEQEHIGSEALGFVSFMASSGVLPPHMREIVIDRAMATDDSPVALDDLKIIVLMVYWSFGQEPDALVLDELCDDTTDRVGH